MKIIALFVIVSLAILPVWSQRTFNENSLKCKCVPRNACGRFSSFQPRSVEKLHCTGTQVCCPFELLAGAAKDASDDDDQSEPVAPKPKSKGKPKPAPKPEPEPDADNYSDSESDGDNNDRYNSFPEDKKNFDHIPKNNKCGVPGKSGIVRRLVADGSFASLHEFPWQAAILQEDKKTYVFRCAGVLIDDRRVVTTAHNMQQMPANSLLVRLGEHDLSTSEESLFQPRDIPVEHIHVHPQYDHETMANDVAIICLKPQKYSRNVAPICLPRNSKQNFVNRQCVVSGWGKDSLDGKYSNKLKKLELKVVERKYCQEVLSRETESQVRLHRTLMCAGGEENRDACQGDGGAPLGCRDADGSMYLAGIVSFGFGCGAKSVPGVYANIAELLPWINSVRCDDNGYDDDDYKPKDKPYSPPKNDHYGDQDYEEEKPNKMKPKPKPKPKKPKYEEPEEDLDDY